MIWRSARAPWLLTTFWMVSVYMTASTLSPAGHPRPAHTALPTPSSLRGAALSAGARGEPLVVMTSLKACPYCDVVRNHHLLPMLRAGEVVAIQIDVGDRTSHLQGFAGDTTTPAEQARVWKARFAPTVFFSGRMAGN